MKNYKLISIIGVAYLLLASCILYFSCNKVPQNEKTKIEVNTKTPTRSDKTVYEDFGRTHNALVNEYTNTYTHQSLATTYNNMKYLASELGYSCDYLPTETYVNITKNNTGEFYDNETELLNNLKGKYKLFGTEKLTFENKIERFKDFLSQMEQCVTADAGLSFIDQYEAVIDNTTMPEEERHSILCCIYTARYSLKYWKDHLGVEDLSKPSRGLKCWVCVVGYDALGGIVTSTLTGNPLVGILAGASWSVFARYCLCKKCSQYNTVSCN